MASTSSTSGRTKRDLGPRTHEPTGGQTVGPFFAFGLDYDKKHQVVFPHSPGSIVLGGTVLDGAGAPIPDAVIEIWSADENGRIPTAGELALRSERWRPFRAYAAQHLWTAVGLEPPVPRRRAS